MIIVPPEGSLSSNIAIIGEAPGMTEELEGRPFCGQSGNILNMKLHTIGVARQECYITNVVKTRPPGNDFSIYWKKHIPKPELLQARDELLNELEASKANIFIALGSNALWALTGQSSIGKWRGSIMECKLPSGRVVKTIGTYHPAAVLRQWSFGAIVSRDFKKALEQSAFPEVLLPQRNLIIEPTYGDIESFVSKGYNACFNLKQPFLTYDIETSHNLITCCSIAFSKNEAISIPTTKAYWGGMSSLKKVLDTLEWLLTRPELTKVGQNISFDIQYLFRAFKILPSKPWYDTMIAQHSCYSEMPKGLGFLASLYTNEPYYKDDLHIWQAEVSNLQMLWRYNARDAAVTYEVKEALEKEIDDLGVRHTFNFMMELVEPLLYMMLRGLRFDEAKREEYRKVLIPQMKQKIEGLKEVYGDVNPSSPKQVSALITKLGLDVPINKKTGKPTTNKKALERLSKKSPELNNIISIRNERTIISNYIEMDVDSVDNRIRCSFNSTGTETGRLSSSESVFGSGRNLQNFPQKIRDMIIPDEGMMFTECDLDGAEARVVAYFCQDDQLINIMNSGKSVHTYTANLIWGVSDEEVNKDKNEKENEGRGTESLYYRAKRIRHSCNYKGTWVTVSEQLGITAAEAKKLIQKYYNASPNLVKWHKRVEDEIKRSRTIITPLSRKRIFFDRIGEKLFKEAIAYAPQETVASVLNLGLIRFYNEVCSKHKDIEILLQVHDSLLVQHPPEKKELVYKELYRCMRVDLNVRGREFFIPIKIKSGMNWRDMK